MFGGPGTLVLVMYEELARLWSVSVLPKFRWLGAPNGRIRSGQAL